MAVSLSREQQQAAISLGADMAAARFARECRAEGLGWILLKGPSIAARLYTGDELRPYVDLDVLVAPPDYRRAEALLARLGYSEASHLPRQRVEHASPWRAPGAVAVDLHRRIAHIPADPALVWSALATDTEVVRVATEEVEVVGLHALPLLVALHALHHGRANAKPLKDLSLAASRLPSAAWRDTRRLAMRLGAERNLAAALSLTPESRALATQLDLPRVRGWEVALRSGDPPRVASAFRLLRETSGLRRKIEVLKQELVPMGDMRGRAKGSAGSSARVFFQRLGLGIVAGPTALAAWWLERTDVRRLRRRSTR